MNDIAAEGTSAAYHVIPAGIYAPIQYHSYLISRYTSQTLVSLGYLQNYIGGLILYHNILSGYQKPRYLHIDPCPGTVGRNLPFRNHQRSAQNP